MSSDLSHMPLPDMPFITPTFSTSSLALAFSVIIKRICPRASLKGEGQNSFSPTPSFPLSFFSCIGV